MANIAASHTKIERKNSSEMGLISSIDKGKSKKVKSEKELLKITKENEMKAKLDAINDEEAKVDAEF